MNRFIKTSICFILCAFLLFGCNVDMSGINSAVDSILPVKLTGRMKNITVEQEDGIRVDRLEFKKISFTSTDVDVEIRPADKARVEVSYPSDMDEHGFSVTVKDGKIVIDAAKQTNFAADEFKMIIYANIEEVVISGGIELEMNAEKANNIFLDVAGGADIYIYNIDADKVELFVAGAASMDLSGKAEELYLDLKGAGDIDAKSLASKKADIRMSGAGSMELSVIDELLADIDGVGTLAYYGDPVLNNYSGGLTDIKQISKEIYGG